ncbi:uncharacterized protein NECHADRAFT_76016 [Fusarium vanettenii 77-13-4]|uniref:FAD/NAD(P)-binding domain-containing protein n=1 Tax=Fusarium vanettenii (strain ATCC MYA-4622 / CBS 123669 / FGSC 9596 / NRRL 45880 / 77-13-4) TaxID=660122 RepID=C7Z687_FUSV7|nr:uncharacterized protein NECHADRAFT_76016 [Fusarium vanettenii 77-13-4]EEU40655.1 hypothetical protein NECHADRAFT_76016 [Fusarium vanettenii 77-13-4]
MAIVNDLISPHEEYPPAADLRTIVAERPIPVLLQDTVDLISLTNDEARKQALGILDDLNAALAENYLNALERCFFSEQAYWKDTLALTYHLRTFFDPRVIAANLLETRRLRGINGRLELDAAAFTPTTPTLNITWLTKFSHPQQFIDASISFETKSPSAWCSGRVLLLPVKNDDKTLEWKIWVLSTKLENLDLHLEDESLLELPGRKVDNLDQFETDVFIIGGGNAAVALAARLKALGVESFICEKNGRVGDNWARRYDNLRFHLPTSVCELPYTISKHLVQATGVRSQKPHRPLVIDEGIYKGISIHSVAFKNGNELKNRGVKSVLIIGSGNSAFDIVSDCHAAGLKTTMVARSPTYIIPFEHVCHEASFGVYEHGVEAADRLFMTLPTMVQGQLTQGLLQKFASEEPDRYAPLAAAGFPVIDSTDPSQLILSNLLERSHSHYLDLGDTELIVDKKVGIKAGVEPVAFATNGLDLSDNSILEADAIIWCTGFADQDVRNVAEEILGGHGVSTTPEDLDEDKNLLGPRDIASRLDATWGIDSEGEIRGMWKRHLRLENYWVMGGATQYHRWHSRTLALQIKAALEGILPPAYRETRGL